MPFRVIRATLAAGVLASPHPVAAQVLGTTEPTVETTVTFVIPVNLTQLSPDLEKVRAICMVYSAAIVGSAQMPAGFTAPQDELPVTGGQLVTTMRVVFPIFSGWLQDAVGKPAQYECGFMGYSKSLQRWDFFSETASDPALRLKPTPKITGSFVW